MPDGTTMNEVFAARVHKSNAAQIKEDARDAINYATYRLLILAASTPTTEEKEMLVQEVDENVAEIIHHSWREWAAEYIGENGELCIDELEEV